MLDELCNHVGILRMEVGRKFPFRPDSVVGVIGHEEVSRAPGSVGGGTFVVLDLLHHDGGLLARLHGNASDADIDALASDRLRAAGPGPFPLSDVQQPVIVVAGIGFVRVERLFRLVRRYPVRQFGLLRLVAEVAVVEMSVAKEQRVAQRSTCLGAPVVVKTQVVANPPHVLLSARKLVVDLLDVGHEDAQPVVAPDLGQLFGGGPEGVGYDDDEVRIQIRRVEVLIRHALDLRGPQGAHIGGAECHELAWTVRLRDLNLQVVRIPLGPHPEAANRAVMGHVPHLRRLAEAVEQELEPAGFPAGRREMKGIGRRREPLREEGPDPVGGGFGHVEGILVEAHR